MNEEVSFDDEPLILVDESGTAIGSKPKLECHVGEGVLHKAFSVFVFNSKSEVLLQKRSKEKMLWPSHWSNSCCSHPRLDENEVDAAKRRMFQELGISVQQLEKHFEFEYQATFRDIGSEWEHCSVFTAVSDDRVNINANEVEAIDWIPINELATELAARPKEFTPWIKLEWERLLPMLVK